MCRAIAGIVIGGLAVAAILIAILSSSTIAASREEPSDLDTSSRQSKI